jgi:transposase
MRFISCGSSDLTGCASVLCLTCVQPPKRALSDITNTHTFDFSSPIKRARSEPLPAQVAAAAASSSPLTRLTPMHRSAIVTLRYDNQPVSTIATKVGTTEKTVRHWIDRWDENGHVEDEQRSGRPQLLSEAEKTSIAVSALVTKFTTPKEIRRTLDLSAVSPRTVRRALDEAGIFGRIARFSPPLTAEHQRKRMSFAQGYGGWTEQKWDTVLWSDETSIRLGPSGQVWVQRGENEEWDPAHVMHKEKHAAKVHMWGCFSGTGMGGCFLFTQNLEKVLMKKILATHLLPSARRLFPNSHWWFQQDNDPKHKSHLVQNWIKSKGIDVLEWPPYSPDLNPIENLWSDLKRRVEKRNPKTVEKLTQFLKEEWKATDPELISKLVHSMPRRCAAVVQKAGWMTGY